MTAYCPPVDEVVMDRTMGLQLPEGAKRALQSLKATTFWGHAQVARVRPAPASMTEVAIVDMSADLSDLHSVDFDVIDDSELW